MRDAKFIMGNKRILPIFICEQTTTTGAASEIGCRCIIWEGVSAMLEALNSGGYILAILHQLTMIKRCRSRQKSGQFKRKSETKTSIRCGNSAAEEFDRKILNEQYHFDQKYFALCSIEPTQTIWKLKELWPK
ncbi:hypothetical protein T4E_5497 [Trichinella pseudospiralis]|uniref:Uncharacterized protein n=1 Tax=Trichinella pseudospiralis TaxID=6337 RepID=A0A0V0YHA0_TRIPS|nr:hypothetical protein T4E_5497 [Trichinella pseudospiralis]